MNCFAINENDQFEIAAFQSLFQTTEIHVHFDENKALQAVENLTRKQMEGLYYFYRIHFYIPSTTVVPLLVVYQW